jgi:hypothetical protein
MKESLERHGASKGHAACSGTAPLGESIWKFRARNASLHFDHTVLAHLIARRWKEDRPYFALRKIARGALPESLVMAVTDVEAAAVDKSRHTRTKISKMANTRHNGWGMQDDRAGANQR